MRPNRILLGLLTATLMALVPLAAAQDAGGDTNTGTDTGTDTGGDAGTGGGNDVPDQIDVDITDNDGGGDAAEESVGFMGLSGTALIVLVVLAIIVVALIVALAGRDRYP